MTFHSFFLSILSIPLFWLISFAAAGVTTALADGFISLGNLVDISHNILSDFRGMRCCFWAFLITLISNIGPILEWGFGITLWHLFRLKHFVWMLHVDLFRSILEILLSLFKSRTSLIRLFYDFLCKFSRFHNAYFLSFFYLLTQTFHFLLALR